MLKMRPILDKHYMLFDLDQNNIDSILHYPEGKNFDSVLELFVI